MKTSLLAACLAVVAFAAPASSEEKIAEYFALIDATDRQNSRGVPIDDFCGVVQQDRANFHRFGKRHEFDQSDPIFAEREVRARIAPLCKEAGGFPALANGLRTYGSTYIWVHVFGTGSTPTRIMIYQGAG